MNKYRCVLRLLRVSIAVASLAPWLPAVAAWDVGMTADVGVIHTDNLFIAPDGAEESETVYTVAPEFTFLNEREGLEADIRYRPEAYFYSDFSEADEVFHVVDAIFRAALVRDRLFLYLNGTHFQSIDAPAGPIPTTNLPVSENRIDSTILEARPSWVQPIGSARMQLEGGYRDIEYGGDSFQSSVSKDGSFDLDNFQRQQGLAWGLNYNYRRLEYDISDPFDFQQASLNLGIWFGGTLRVFGVGGRESSVDNVFDGGLDEDFWEAGFEYRPNQRLALELAAGDRSYGSSLRADFSYSLRRGSITLLYNETPSSGAEDLFRVRPLGESDDLDQILFPPGNVDRFVRKRGDIQANVDLAKSNLSLRIFSEERKSRSSSVGLPLGDESFAGIEASWEWRFGSKTTVDIAADFATRENDFVEDDLSRLTLGVDYQVSPRTLIRFEIARSEQDGAVQSSYVENQGRLLIQLELL